MDKEFDKKFMKQFKKMPCLKCLVGILCLEYTVDEEGIKHIRLKESCRKHNKWSNTMYQNFWKQMDKKEQKIHTELCKKIIANFLGV